jgi:hypothetical protein
MEQAVVNLMELSGGMTLNIILVKIPPMVTLYVRQEVSVTI